VAQVRFQRTALQPVYRHDYVHSIHGCVMTRARSRRRRVLYCKLFWAGEPSRPLTLASAATAVCPDAPLCPPFFCGSSVVPPPKLDAGVLCPWLEANAAWYRVHRMAGVTCRFLSVCFAASQEAARHNLRTRQEQELQVLTRAQVLAARTQHQPVTADWKAARRAVLRALPFTAEYVGDLIFLAKASGGESGESTTF
jgi:hypothetical protein